MTKNLSYPIGTYTPPAVISNSHIANWTQEIEDLPKRIESLVGSLTANELSYTYRPNGWNIAQVVHHLCDSHLNAYTRFKLTMTELNPTIRPYNEALWAEHPDATQMDLSASMALLNGLHSRWSTFIKNLSPEDLKRTFYHPERELSLDLAFTVGDYAWHGNHHAAHIKQALALKHK